MIINGVIIFAYECDGGASKKNIDVGGLAWTY